MPRVVIQSKNLTLNFPDGMSEKEMADAIDANFPRDGKDVEYDINNFGEKARNSLTVDDLRLYKEYKQSQPSEGVGWWADTILKGVGALGETVAQGVGAAVEEPGKVIPSSIEGAARGTYDLVNLLSESTNPASFLFRVKNLVTNTGTEQEQLDQWKQALEIRDKRERIARGEESLFVPLEEINPKQAEAASLVLDPTMLVPGLGVGGKGAVLAERAVGAGLKGAGKVLGKVAQASEKVGSLAREAVEKAVKLSPEEAARVANFAGVGGFGFAAAADPLSALTFAGASKLTGPLSEALQATGEAMGKGAGRITPLMQVAADESISSAARTIANVASRVGGGVVLDVAPRTVAGLIEGGSIGALLGYLSDGQEGAAQGLGAGMAAGALGATAGRGFQYALDPLGSLVGGTPFRNSIRNERVTADFERTLRKMSPEQAERASAFAANMASKSFDVRPLVADIMDATGNIGRRIEFIRDGEMPLRPDGSPLFEDTKFQGVSVNKDPAAGIEPVIYINVDRAGKSTLPHEIVHALRDTLIGERYVDDARKFIFGIDGAEVAPDLAGQMVRPAGVSKETILQFAEQYAKTGKNADKFRKAAEGAYDPNLPLEERIHHQKVLADEMLAFYAGFNAVGGLKGTYKDILLKGKLPSVISTMFDLAKDVTISKLSRDGAFDFSKGLETGFFDKGGKKVKIKPMDQVVKESFTALRDGTLDPTEPTTVLSSTQLGKDGMERINTIFGTKIFDVATGGVGEDIKPSLKPAKPTGGPIDPEGITDARPLHGGDKGNPTKPQKEFVKDVLTADVKPEEVASGVGSFHTEKNGDVVFPVGMSEAQAEKVAASLNSRQRRIFYQLRKDSIDGINRIYITTHAAETKKPKGIERGPGSQSVKDSFIAVSNGEVIPYQILMNKRGQVRSKMLDLGLVSRRLKDLLSDKRFKGAFDSALDAREAFISTYLPNLAKGTEPSAAVLADKNGKFGDVRRDLFYEAIKPPMPETFINPPSEGYAIKRSDRSVFRDYSLRNILSMAPSGGSTAFDPKAYTKLKQNFMPSKIGDKQAFTNGDGVRVIEGKKGWRLYSPDGSLNGVYGSLDDALMGGKKVSSSFQPDVDNLFLSAVKAGDIDYAKSIADDAAAKAGFVIKAFHGSPVEGIKEFKTPLFTAKSELTAGNYSVDYTGAGQTQGAVYPVYIKPGKTLKLWQSKDWVDVVEKLPGDTSKLKKLLVDGFNNEKFAGFDKLRTDSEISDFVKRGRTWESYKKKVLEDRKRLGSRYFGWNPEGYDLSATFKTGASDADLNFTNNAPLIEELFKFGFDTISQLESGYSPSEDASYIVKNPSQIKSAEPVTFDDAGNVIPPSKRFNKATPDIRFQPSGESELATGAKISSTELRDVDLKAIAAFDKRKQVEAAMTGDTTEAARAAYFATPEAIQERYAKMQERRLQAMQQQDADIEAMIAQFRDRRLAEANQFREQSNRQAESSYQEALKQSVPGYKTPDEIAIEEFMNKAAEGYQQRKRKALEEEVAAASSPVPPPASTDEAFRRVIDSRRKPVVKSTSLSGAFFPAAVATERELQRR